MEQTLRQWARAYREGPPEHRFPSDPLAEFFPVDMDAAAAEIERLRRDCAELYQVIGTMAEHCPDPTDPAIVKALDNASDAAAGDPRRHDDLLPFVLPEPRVNEQETQETK